MGGKPAAPLSSKGKYASVASEDGKDLQQMLFGIANESGGEKKPKRLVCKGIQETRFEDPEVKGKMGRQKVLRGDGERTYSFETINLTRGKKLSIGEG